MSNFNVPKILGEVIDSLRTVARHPEILAVSAMVHTGCKEDTFKGDASSVPAKVCVGQMDDYGGPDTYASENMALTSLGELGFTHLQGEEDENGVVVNGGTCVVKAYTMTNPDTLLPVSMEGVAYEIDNHLVAFAQPASDSWGDAVGEEGYVKSVYLSTRASTFDETDPYGGNLFAAVCPEPEWQEESTVYFTDDCVYFVPVDSYDNYSGDTVSAIPEWLQMDEEERAAAIEAKYGRD